MRERVKQMRGVWVLLAVGLSGISACKRPLPEVATGPKSFATQESAGRAVYLAAKAGDKNALIGIFGPEEREYLTTGDDEQDKLAYAEFATDYEQMHRWSKAENGGLVLNVGVENYPFPFPLVRNAEGQWSFSTEEAKKEILARRIGGNELKALDVLNAIGVAQDDYYARAYDGKAKQYALRFVSSEGKHDGLYWKAEEGQEESPLGPLAAQAGAEGYKAPEPFRGYYYRILRKQGPHAEGGAKDYVVSGKMTGGFAIVAYPAEYRKTGVMTFVMNQNRVVWQKDLGVDTVVTAKGMESYDPDESWEIVQ